MNGQKQIINRDIVVSYVNERQGRRPASIKAQGGEYFTITDAAYNQGIFQQGSRYSIGFWEKPGNNGTAFKIIDFVNGQPIPADTQHQGQQYQGQQTQGQQYQGQGQGQQPVGDIVTATLTLAAVNCWASLMHIDDQQERLVAFWKLMNFCKAVGEGRAKPVTGSPTGHQQQGQQQGQQDRQYQPLDQNQQQQPQGQQYQTQQPQGQQGQQGLSDEAPF